MQVKSTARHKQASRHLSECPQVGLGLLGRGAAAAAPALAARLLLCSRLCRLLVLLLHSADLQETQAGSQTGAPKLKTLTAETTTAQRPAAPAAKMAPFARCRRSGSYESIAPSLGVASRIPLRMPLAAAAYTASRPPAGFSARNPPQPHLFCQELGVHLAAIQQSLQLAELGLVKRALLGRLHGRAWHTGGQRGHH